MARMSSGAVGTTLRSDGRLLVVFTIEGQLYNGGRFVCAIDVAVQNVQDIVAGNSASYDVAVSIDGSTAYSKTAVTQSYLTRWRKTFVTGGLVEAGVTPDFEPFYAAGAVPRYLPTIEDVSPASTGAKFDILGFGDMMADMGAPVVAITDGAITYSGVGSLSGNWLILTGDDHDLFLMFDGRTATDRCVPGAEAASSVDARPR